MAVLHSNDDLTARSKCEPANGRSWIRSRWATLLAAGLVVGAGGAAYSNSFWGPFIYDDLGSIVDNSGIRHLGAIGRVLAPPANGETVSGRPLLNLSFAIDYAIGGTNTWNYHATNLAIHLLNGLLLLGIIGRTLCLPVLRARFGNAALGLAMAIGLLWVLHPLQTESVTYIVQRAESLAAMFYLLVIYCVIRGIETPRGVRWHILAVTACLLGVATKETVATAPVLVLLYDWAFVSGSFRESLRRRWGLYLGLAASWALLLELMWSTGLVVRQEEFGVVDPWSYVRSQPGVILHYLRLSLWPNPLCFNYDWPVACTLPDILPGALVVAMLLAATVWGLTKGRRWGFLGAWFFLILAPTSSIMPLKQLAFEHRMYLPLAAVVTAVVFGAHMVCTRQAGPGRVDKRACLVVGVCAVTLCAVVLGLLTGWRNETYRTGLSIWRDTVAKAPRNPCAHNNLGLELARCGRLPEAIEHYREAIRLKPGYFPTYSNLGLALADSGRPGEAVGCYERALQSQPDEPAIHYNLGNALMDLGQLPAAIEHFARSVEIDRHRAIAQHNLGLALAQAGRLAEAIEHYQQALQIEPHYAVTHMGLGDVLYRLGRTEEAVAQYQEAIRLMPELAESHFSLFAVFVQKGKFREAIEHGNEAARLKPNDPDVARLVAWVMATHDASQGGDPLRGVELAERACSLAGRRDFACLDTLGAAYASAGRFDEAVLTAREAWQLAQAAGQGAMAEEIHIRLQLYRDHRPYRESVPSGRVR
jgi:tetratricopeptide (TPR) repeat protein